MKVNQRGIVLEEKDLKEIFGLFSSPTKNEKAQSYQRRGGHYFEDENLSEEYNLTQEKREFALDAWRAIISFLHAHDFTVAAKSGEKVDLSFIEKEFT
jgi:hypothetical protein